VDKFATAVVDLFWQHRV